MTSRDNESELQLIVTSEKAAAQSLPIHHSSVGSRSGSTDFMKQASNFLTCFVGLQVSYLTWGYCQESLMTTTFKPTPNAPSGLFPSAAFAVFR